MNQFNMYKPLIGSCWFLACVSIVLLSVYGRSLQYWVADTIGYNAAAWVIGLLLFTIIVVSLYWLTRLKIEVPWMHLLWFIPLFLMVPLLLERVEERLHFLTFGTFGALSILLFYPRLAFVVCLLGSAGDELLQFYLPDRVGDWRDVGMNSLASLSAAYFVYSIRQANTDTE